MGSSQSIQENDYVYSPMRQPSQIVQKEKYNLETLIKASESQFDDFSPEERQRLQQKMDGANVEGEASYENQRYNLILEFYNCLLECLQTPTEYKPLELIYIRYKNTFLKPHNGDKQRQGTEPLSKAVLDAYITLDFWRVCRNVSDNGRKLWEAGFVKQIEQSFKTGVRPQQWAFIPHSINLPGMF